ncbi:cytochrome b5-like [Galleria mellonella]|uniref:Cytochrome b5 n=1 Tax=Galleria mellonella TaxID=7137 RepID=A0A6J3BZM4_GALME|nr:cytochrome b5-like [Galleria mellonella]XP_052748957.1 cytochrome b5-like [Galleria mellonella]
MTREISFAEIKKHNNEKSVWIVIHNDVYDVTSYLGEHPGGEDALLEVAGKDGTQNFEDVGHSEDARNIMKKFKIGTLPPSERTGSSNITNCSNLKWAVLALAGAIVVGIVLKKYLS